MSDIMVIGDKTTEADIRECLRNLTDAARKSDEQLMRMHDLREQSAVKACRDRGDRISFQLEGMTLEAMKWCGRA